MRSLSALSLFITACNDNQSQQANNQFTLKGSELYFGKNIISEWPLNTPPPYCINCNKSIDSSYTKTGPTIFRKVNDHLGNLVLLDIKRAQYSFAMVTNGQQYSWQLNIVDNQLQLINNQGTNLLLPLKQKVMFTLGEDSYFAYLKSIGESAKKSKNSENGTTSTKVNLLIWKSQ